MSDHYFKRLLAVLAIAVALAFLATRCHAASFPYIRLNAQTNRISDNGTALTYNGTPVGNGGLGNVVAGNQQIRFDWAPGTIATNVSSTLSVVFPGIKHFEPLVLGVPVDLGAGLVATVTAIAPDQARVTLSNPTMAGIAAGAGKNWKISRLYPNPPSMIPLTGTGIITNGLIAAYDMVTFTNSGAKLYDHSGYGNHGTVHSITTNAQGVIFNGSSSWIDIPALIKSTNQFTVLILASGPGTTGRAWSECDNPVNNNVLTMNAGGSALGSWTTISGNGGGIAVTWNDIELPIYGSDWHLYYLQRSEAGAAWGVLDENLYESKSLGNLTTVNSTVAALGAIQLSAGSPGQFWTGTNAYTLIYSGYCPTPSDLASIYNSIRATVQPRGLYLRDLTAPLYPGRVWQRQGTVIASPTTWLANMKALHTTTDCKLIGRPDGFTMILDSNFGILYAESPDGIHWLPPLGSGLTGPLLTGVTQPGWVKDPSSGKYYMSAQTNDSFNIYVSPVGTPNSYSLLAANVLNASGMGYGHINNSGMTVVSNTAYMLFDTYSPHGFSGATSTDFSTWTPAAFSFNGYNTTDTLWGPSPFYINGTWYSWGHTAPASLPFGVHRRKSSTFNAIWQRMVPSGNPLNGEGLMTFEAGLGNEAGQLASATLVEDGSGRTFLYYCASAASTLVVKCAIANMTMAQLVTTGEGSTSDYP